MNENYPSDVKLDENPDGTVSFATDVIATIAGLAATEVEGVASMSSPASGLADMFARKSTRNLTKGVRIDLDGSNVNVDITIVVEYGFPVPEVARGIQENVKKGIETMTGLNVSSVDIHVSGISFEREQRAAKEIEEQHKKMLEESEQNAESETAASPSEEPAVAVTPVEEPVAEPEDEDEDEIDEDDEDIEIEEEIDEDLDLEDEDDVELIEEEASAEEEDKE